MRSMVEGAAVALMLTTSAHAAPMTWAELTARPKPQPTRTVFYGDDPNQFAQMWLPAGRGPFPVVVMIHGGCWQASIANLSLMSYAAEDLRRHGIAVWNIEYRSADQKGGGYPGTYRDVGAAIDRLAIEAPHDHVSMGRVIALGHSAGGQLALWAAARGKLPPSSPLRWAAPQPIAGVVDIAGLPNLKTDTDTACGAAVLKQMGGVPTRARPDVYSDTSPVALLPLGVRQIVVHGAQDTTVPLAVSERYVAAAKAAGDRIELRTPPGNHVEEIAPGQAAWAAAVQAVHDLLAEAPVR